MDELPILKQPFNLSLSASEAQMLFGRFFPNLIQEYREQGNARLANHLTNHIYTWWLPQLYKQGFRFPEGAEQ